MQLDRIPDDWKQAVELLSKEHGCKTLSIFGEDQDNADFIAWFPTSSPLGNGLDADLSEIKRRAGRLSFSILPYSDDAEQLALKAKFEEQFHVLEWFAFPGKIVCTAKPWLISEWKNAKAVLSPDQRWENIRSNTPRISKRPPYTDTPHDRRAVIVNFGPSLKDTWSGIAGERKYFQCDVVTNSGAHDFLVQRKIIPDYHVECDPRPHKLKLLSSPNNQTKYYIASVCVPEMFDKFDGFDVTLWHCDGGKETEQIWAELEKDAVLVGGGSCIGLRAITLFYALGYRKFSIYGMDCSFSDDGEEQWAGSHSGKVKEVHRVKCGNRIFNTAPVMTIYAQEFLDTVDRLSDCEFWMHGDGLLQHMCAVRTRQVD